MKKVLLGLTALLSFSTFAAGDMLVNENFRTPAFEQVGSSHSSLIISDSKYDNFMESVDSPLGGDNLSFEQLIDLYKVNGMGIVIIENGVITQEHYYGYETKNKITPITKHTRFQAASMSKYIAGLAGAIADEQGHVKLGRKVSKMADANPKSLLDEWRDKKFKKKRKRLS
jgi:CubicO group peptidase (beta-lactamase class C family)